jgi:drug/metabolite transporter (DMT)-like permease
MRRVVLLAFIWGWSFLFIKVAVAGMTPSAVAFGRIALGMMVMLVILRVRGVALPRDRTMWRHFAVMGMTYSAAPFTLLAWSEQHITSALTAVLNASTPLFAALAAAIGLGERLKRVQIGGLVLGFAGVAVAAGLGGRDLASSSVVGVGAALVASACYGFSFAYARRNLVAVQPLVAVGGQLVTGALFVLPLALVTTVQEGIELAPRRMLAMAILGVVGTGLAYVINYQSIAEIGATRASLVTFLVPIVAVTVGVVFLSEPFHIQLVLGGALTILGIAVLRERLGGVRRLGAALGALLLVLALGLGACIEDNGGALHSAASSGSCGKVQTEALAPDSLKHVLPGSGAAEPSYATDPPTSGPHRPVGNGVVGVQAAPLDKPTQVGVLEAGGVLLQWRGLGDEDRRRLERQAGGDVRVAPNPGLPSAVVATAWGHKLTCTGLDVEALKSFVRAYAGKGADGSVGPGHG